MQEEESRIDDKLEEEILALDGVKFQLALKAKLRKDNPDGSEEYTDCVLHHKQKALLQASEINEDLNNAISHLLELLACGVCGGVCLCCPFSHGVSWMGS